jgi:hypothetical protein
VLVLFSEIDGMAGSVDAAAALRGDNAILYRNRISGGADGVQISGSKIRLLENIITTRRASKGEHNDTIQLLGDPEEIEISGNDVSNPNPQTSCITILGRNVEIRGNRLSGGGWTIYGGKNNNGHGGGSATAVVVADNIFARDRFPKIGFFGAVSYWDSSNVWRGNRSDDGASLEVR